MNTKKQNIHPSFFLRTIVVALYVGSCLFLLLVLQAALSPAHVADRAGGAASAGGSLYPGLPDEALLWIVALVFMPSFNFLLKRISRPLTTALCLLPIPGIACIAITAFNAYPPLLERAYFARRYAAHPIYAGEDFIAAGAASFLLAGACCIWLVCQAFPQSAARCKRTTLWASGIGGFLVAYGLIQETGPALVRAQGGYLIVTVITAAALAGLVKAVRAGSRPHCILAAYALLFAGMNAGLLYLLQSY